jgi:hypothetical protein
MHFSDRVCVLPAGLESFYLPSFLSASIFGGLMANINPLCALCVLCGEEKLRIVRYRINATYA